MKKRLLSAALALAMVLTMLPLTVFAADEAIEKKTAYYHVSGSDFAKADTSNTTKASDDTGWYIRTETTNAETGKGTGKYTYEAASDGVVASVSTKNGDTATWYSGVGGKLKDSTTNVKPDKFTLVGDVDITKLDWTLTSVKLDGHTLDIKAYDTAKAQSITVSGTGKTGDASELKLPSDSKLVGKSLTVKATNAKVSGGITVENEEYASEQSSKIKVKTYGSGSITLTGGELAANIDLPKGSVSLSGTAKNTSNTITIGTCGSSLGGTVTLDHGASVKGVKLYGPSTLNVYDTSSAGAVTVFGGGKADVSGNVKYTGTVDKMSNPSWSGASINVKTGGTITSIGAESESRNGLADSAIDLGTGVTNTDTTKHTIKAETRGNVGTVDLDYANVTLTGAGATSVAVKVGNVTLSSNATAGTITLGDESKKVNGKCELNISGDGTYVTTKADASNVAATNMTVKVTGGNIKAIDLPDDYKGGGITGGSFGAAVEKAAWLGNVTYQIETKAEKTYPITYTNSFEKAVSAYTDTASKAAADQNKVAIVGTTGNNTISFVLDDKTTAPAFVLGADENTLVRLPTVIGKRSVTKWYDGDTPLTAGELYPMGGKSVTLKATSTEADLGTINGVTATVKTANAKSPNLTASLSGSTIKLSGAVDTDTNNYAPIELVFTTTTSGSDAADVAKLTVTATYYADEKTVRFTGTAGDSLEVSNDYKEVGLKGSNVKFTVDCSGLAKLQSVDAMDAAKEQVVTVSGTNLGNTEKSNLIEKLKGVTFDYENSPALNQALNKALASYTESGVKSAITAGQKEAAKKLFDTSSPTKTQLADDRVTAYTDLKIQMYLDIQVTNVTSYGSGTSGSITLNITPKYHEVVVNPTATQADDDESKDPPEIVNPSAKSLDSTLLKSTDGAVEITLPVSDLGITVFQSGKDLYAHHGDYVYAVKEGTFTDLHGFSTFVIDTNGPVAEVDKIVRNGKVVGGAATEEDPPAAADPTDGPFYYDSLTAAVADVANEGTVVVKAGYKGTTTIPVTGSSRQFTVNNKANAGTALTFTGANVTSNGKNDEYQVELTKDNYTSAVISVGTASNGSASVSASTAVPGATVSGTIKPNTGYKAGAFTATAKTATGNVSVDVSVDADKNTFSFVVPAGATSVSVTPAFVSANQATIRVGSATGGYAVTNVADGDAAAHGSTVTVTTVPNSGYRTINATARTNSGATVAVTRNGLNSFSFVVPTTATAVTVTPSFDLDNNTPFSDVLSSRWSSDDVAWIYNKGYTTGYGNMYTFAPTVECTRWEMVTFLWKAAGYKQVNIANPFQDVSATYPNAQAYQAIMWAVSQGLVDTSTGYFYPTNKISRAAAVEILYKQAGSPPASTSNGFKDVPATASYAKAVSWAEANGITNGKDNRDTFKPNDTITRQEIAKMLHVAFG